MHAGMTRGDMPVVGVHPCQKSGPRWTANWCIDEEVLEIGSTRFHELLCERQRCHTTKCKVLVVCEKNENVWFAAATCNQCTKQRESQYKTSHAFNNFYVYWTANLNNILRATPSICVHMYVASFPG